MKNNLLILDLSGPVNGVVNVNRHVADMIKDSHIVDITLQSKHEDIGKINPKKLSKFIFNIMKIITIFLKRNTKSIYYVPSASNIGIIKDLLLLLPFIFTSVPRYYHLHSFTYFTSIEKSLFYRVIFSILLLGNVTAICLCRKQVVILARIFPKLKTEFLYNPITIAESEMNADRSVTQFSELSFVYLGTISAGKGIYGLIDALCDITDINFELIVMGGPFSSIDREKILALTDQLSFIDYKGEVVGEERYQIIKDAHLGFFPSSLCEGSPLVIPELQSLGIPVISSDVGCVSETIGNGGIVIDSITKVNVRQAILTILRNYNYYSSEATAAAQKHSLGEFELNLTRIMQL